MPAPDNLCGGCTSCCEILEIRDVPEIGTSPARELCAHACKGEGCGIYKTRPLACRKFECLWLRMQFRPDGKPSLASRPDQCGVMITQNANTSLFIVHSDPKDPESWRQGAAWELCSHLLDQGIILLITGEDETLKQLVHRKHPNEPLIIDEIHLTAPNYDGAQWWTMPRGTTW